MNPFTDMRCTISTMSDVSASAYSCAKKYAVSHHFSLTNGFRDDSMSGSDFFSSAHSAYTSNL